MCGPSAGCSARRSPLIPLFVWLFPDDATRLDADRGLARPVRRAIPQPRPDPAIVGDDVVAAVAVWQPPGETALPVARGPPTIGGLLGALLGPDADRGAGRRAPGDRVRAPDSAPLLPAVPRGEPGAPRPRDGAASDHAGHGRRRRRRASASISRRRTRRTCLLPIARLRGVARAAPRARAVPSCGRCGGDRRPRCDRCRPAIGRRRALGSFAELTVSPPAKRGDGHPMDTTTSGVEQLRSLVRRGRPRRGHLAPARHATRSARGRPGRLLRRDACGDGATPSAWSTAASPRRSSTARVGCAVHSTLEPGERYTTVDLHVHYTRAIAVDLGKIVATGEVVHRGQPARAPRRAVSSTPDGKLLAHGTTTCLVMSA